MKKSLIYILIALLNFSYVEAQVGIGTESPNASSILDIESTAEGVLLPRMTTTQREAIASPVNGLTVFDTDAQTYYFYNENESQWEQLSTSRLKRSNYQLVQSEEDFPAPSGGTITLESDTFYEINGMITLENSIELNGAYISGFDSFEDGLNKPTGDLFVGSSGGSMRFLTLSGAGKAFNITGGVSLIVQNTAISGFSNVGEISNINLTFLSIVQYFNNSNGLVYKDIDNLLISNVGWQETNSGTYEKFEGTFNLIQKNSGFSIANGSSTAIDVSSNPTVEDGVISGTVFSGSSTSMIKKYTNTALGINFSKTWFVQAAGIKDEYDDIATGNIYSTSLLTNGFTENVSNNFPFKLNGITASSNLLRFDSPGRNRLTFSGKSERTFRINASLSVRGLDINEVFYSFFIRKNGNTTLVESNSIFYVDNFNNVSSVSITGTVKLAPNDYIEIWAQRLSGTGASRLVIFSQNLTID